MLLRRITPSFRQSDNADVFPSASLFTVFLPMAFQTFERQHVLLKMSGLFYGQSNSSSLPMSLFRLIPFF